MNKIEIDKDVLEYLYIEQGLTMKEIAEKLNISVGSVYNYCHKFGIETRDQQSTFSFKGKKHTDKTRRIISKAKKGKQLSEETKQKMSKIKFKGGIGHKKKRKDGYIQIYMPDHPKSSKDGYIMEHDLIMECAIGRWLEKDEVVHHKNEIKSDNRLINLELMTLSEHISFHAKKRHAEKSITK